MSEETKTQEPSKAAKDIISQKKSLEQRLLNYKAMHKGTAASKNVSEDFADARTLTQARKVLWGYKKKHKKGKG